MRFNTLLLQTSALALLTASVSSAAQAQTQDQTASPAQGTPDSPAGAASTAGQGDITGQSKNDVTIGQRGPESTVTADQVNADGSTVGQSGDIVVTGSLIHRRNLDTPLPTLTVDRQFLEDRGYTNVADALNSLPGIRGSVTPAGAQNSFGQGANFINIGNLGSNRTLTLINGRRFVSSNPNTLFTTGSAGQQVDTNTVQSILLDHVDQVSIGGATIYGSDAIGGTVNYILRDRFSGFEADALSGISDQGDGFRYNAAFIAGHDYLDGRLNVTVAYTHDRQDGILYNARDFLAANYGSVSNPCSTSAAACGSLYIGTLGRPANGIAALNDGRVNTAYGYNNSATDGNPGSILIRDESIYTISKTGVISSATGNSAVAYNYQFDASGNLVPYNKGIVFPSIYASGGDGFRFNDYSQITSDLTRDTANAFAHFDVSDALKFFFEGTFYRSYANELVQQPSFNASAFAGVSGVLTYTTDSPLLTQQARTALTQLGVTRFNISRTNDALADLTGYSNTNIGRAVFGAKGDFGALNRTWHYEAYLNYGRTNISDHSQDINEQHFINAVNVTTNAAGQLVCNVTPTVQATSGGKPIADPNCVPLNLIGGLPASAAAKAYVVQQTDTISVLQQKDAVANISGTLFKLFGNDMGIAAGYEHREEDGQFTPDYFERTGLGRSVAIAPTKGSYNVDEEVGELDLPLLQPHNHVPLLNGLEIDASIRHVNNTVNGGFVAWSGGGTWQPVRDLLLRANYTKSFRGPSITELFLPRSSSFVTVPDLCSPANINAGPAPVTRARNCAAFLAKYPNATPLDAAAATVPGLNGGNPTLQNEVSRSYTYGGVLQPRFLPGLAISADYIDIRIANPITSLTIAQIASGCFDNTSFNADDPANGNNFCSQIQRYTGAEGGTALNGGSRAGQVINDPTNPGVSSGYVNGKRIRYAGIQGTVSYVTGLSGIHLPGKFSTDTTLYFVNRRLVDTTGVGAIRTDGLVGDPKFQFQNTTRYVGDGWGVSGTFNFVGKEIVTRAALSPDLREFNRVDPYHTVDASIWLDVAPNYRLTFAAFNVGNKQYIDYLGAYNTAAGPIDAIGRRYNVSVRIKY